MPNFWIFLKFQGLRYSTENTRCTEQGFNCCPKSMDSILTSTAQGVKEMTEKMTRKHYKVDVIVKVKPSL